MYHPTLADRATHVAVTAFGLLPSRAMQVLAGKPTVIDGQRLHPGVAVALKVLNANQDTFEHHEPEHGRRELAAEAYVFGSRTRVREVRDGVIPGPAGNIPMRLYRDSDTPAGLVMFMHGGGWVLGGLESADSICRVIAKETGLVVVQIDYRLAPEHPFPAAVDDAVAAFRHLRDHADEFGYPHGRIAVAGESAGGNLTCVVAQETKHDAAGGPAFQCPIFPVTDLSAKAGSYALFGDGYFLKDAQMDWYRDHYLADPSQVNDPRVSPLLADDVSGVAPACVVVAGFDVLRDDGLAYARRLRDAEVPCEIDFHEGFIHGFTNATAMGPLVVRRVRQIGRIIQRGLS